MPKLVKSLLNKRRQFKKTIYLMNDVSMALCTKVRSLDELSLDIFAMEAYVACINMTHGRIWDSEAYEPQGWFWSPTEDCANRAKQYLK